MANSISLYDLFDQTQWREKWQTIGNHVNYDTQIINNTLIIFFQGSNEKIDWIRNFVFKKKPYKHMDVSWKAHSGFVRAWKECDDIIGMIVGEFVARCLDKGASPNVLISGYSHGGALAMLCHEYIWFNWPILRNHLETYAFAAPRVMGHYKVPKEVQDRWKNFYLVRNGKDIVTHLPPRIFGFCHAGWYEIYTNYHIGIFKDHMQQHVKEGIQSCEFLRDYKIELQ